MLTEWTQRPDIILEGFMQDEIFKGIQSARSNNLNGILVAIDVIDSKLFQLQGDKDVFTANLGSDSVIVKNILAQMDIFNNFKNLFNIYRDYLQNTSGTISIPNWLSNNTSYTNFLNMSQPVWYKGVDNDNDGQIDVLIEDRRADGSTVKWYESLAPSAILYQELRSGLDSSSSSTNLILSPGQAVFSAPPQSLNMTASSTTPCTNSRYSVEVSEVPSATKTKQNVGALNLVDIDGGCRLYVKIRRCCDGKVPEIVADFYVDSKLSYTKLEPCPINGNLDPNVNPPIGSVRYKYYYTVESILQAFYTNTPDDVLNTILQRGNTGIFVDADNLNRNYCNGSLLTRSAVFFNYVNNPSKFQSTPLLIPKTIGNSTINFDWKKDITDNQSAGFLEVFMLEAGYSTTDIGITTDTEFDGFYTSNLNQLPNANTLMSKNCVGSVVRCPEVGTGTTNTNNTTIGGARTNSGGVVTGGGDCRDKANWELRRDLTIYGEKSYVDHARVSGKVKYIDDNFVADNGLLAELKQIGYANYRSIPNVSIRFISNYTPETTFGKIPEYPCLEGNRQQVAWSVNRGKIVPWRLYCKSTGAEIDYRQSVNPEAYNYVLDLVTKFPDIYPTRSNFPGNEKALTPADYPVPGRFYYEDTFTNFIIQGSAFDRFTGDNIRLSRTSDCAQSSKEVYTYLTDPSNPCSCIEVEILSHYIVYPKQEYIDIQTGTILFTSDAVEELDARIIPPVDNPYGLKPGQEITGQRTKENCGDSPIKTTHPFLFGADVLTGIKKNTIKGLFNYSQSLECYHTGSTQSSSSKDYYYEITDCDNCKKTAYFAVAYGNSKGSGSISSGYEADDSPSKAIYSQYRLLSLDPLETNFKFYDTGSLETPDDIYIINFYRDGLSDKLDIGNFEINLAELSGSGKVNREHTGSKVQVKSNPKILRLIDNSSQMANRDVCTDDPNHYYEIVSGSLQDGVHSSGTGTVSTNTSITTFGIVYPNLGVIVLDGAKLNDYVGFNSVTGSNINGDNSYKLFTAISGASVLNYPMKGRNVKTKTTNHYFVRIPSKDANYSNNPTYTQQIGNQKGKIKNQCFVDNPMSYITTVGLYNNNKELLAIAKLSRPIKKTRENDVLIKIRLNW